MFPHAYSEEFDPEEFEGADSEYLFAVYTNFFLKIVMYFVFLPFTFGAMAAVSIDAVKNVATPEFVENSILVLGILDELEILTYLCVLANVFLDFFEWILNDLQMLIKHC